MGHARAVLLTVLVALLVTAGAVGTAAYLGRGADGTAPPPGSTVQQSQPDGCLAENCHVVATADVGSAKIELEVGEGGKAARVRITELGGQRLVESTIAGLGASLGSDSLQCVAARLSACMVRGTYTGGTVGEVVVGRSGKWNAAERRYFSSAGYLAVIDINGDGQPEVVVVQQGFYAQVYEMDGAELGCTRQFARLNQLPGWPLIKPQTRELTKPCPQPPS